MPYSLREQYEARKKKERTAQQAKDRDLQENATIRWWHLRQRDPIARFTLWLVISTIGLVFATIGTMIVLICTDKNIAAQVAALRDQIRLGTATERSYVFVENISNNALQWRFPGADYRGGFEWKFRFTNHGKTPAIIQKIQAFATICDDTPPIDGEWPSGPRSTPFPCYPHMEVMNIPAQMVLSSKDSTQEFMVHGDRTALNMTNIPEAEMAKREALRNLTVAPINHPRVVRFWLVGSVTYKDVLENDHVTQFSFVLKVPGFSPIEWGPPGYNKRT